MQSELAKLIQQYGCGSVRFAGTDEALYERHLVFDKRHGDERDRRSRTLRGHRSLGARCILAQRWIHTGKTYERQNAKQVLLSLDGIF